MKVKSSNSRPAAEGAWDDPMDLTYRWDLDASNDEDMLVEGATVEVLMDAPGLRRITLTVTDQSGNQVTSSYEIDVKGEARLRACQGRSWAPCSDSAPSFSSASC